MNLQDAIRKATRRDTYWATEMTIYRAIYRTTEGGTDADIYRATVEDIFSSTNGVTELPIQESLKWN